MNIWVSEGTLPSKVGKLYAYTLKVLSAHNSFYLCCLVLTQKCRLLADYLLFPLQEGAKLVPAHSSCAYFGTSGQHPYVVASQVGKIGGKKTPYHFITMTGCVVLHLFSSFARVKLGRAVLLKQGSI